MQHPIEPLYIRYAKSNSVLSIRLNSKSISETVKSIEVIWKEVYPDNLFEYAFMDDDFETLYDNETAFASIFNHLTFLAIFIAVMGLFGLSAFAAEQRTKEIGIRKVLGAKVSQIVFMLSKEFILLVMVAFIFAIPVAWMGAGRWLDTFVYRIDLGWGIFIFSAIAATLVALLTVSWQSLKVALSNPVKSLKDE